MFLDYNNDWTEYYKHRDIVEISNSIIEKSIDKLHENKIDVYYNNSFSRFELSLLLRFPIHVAVNTFIDRLLFVLHNNKINYPDISDEYDSFNHFANTIQPVFNYYNDYELNKSILFKIRFILKKHENKLGINFDNKIPKNQDKTIQNIPIKTLCGENDRILGKKEIKISRRGFYK